MADPCRKPLKWSKHFQVYAEKHSIYDVLQELLKQIIINTPKDPLVFISDNLQRISEGMHNPKVFVVGPVVAEGLGERIASITGAKFITLSDIIQSTPPALRESLSVFLDGQDKVGDRLRQLLVTTIKQRLSGPDCDKKGYILSGFPQSKAQAMVGQQLGLLPRQVFVFLPPTEEEEEEGEDSPYFKEMSTQVSTTQMRMMWDFLTLKDISTAYHYDICKIITYERLSRATSQEMEAELLGVLLTSTPTGAPFIPRIVLLGPPASGKTTTAHHLAKAFSVVSIDWIELIQGATQWDDDISDQAQEFLKTLKPLPEETVRFLLTKRLTMEDCEKRGWVLHGFPGTKQHCKLLEELYLSPNRIFVMACPEEVVVTRMAKKKKNALRRRPPGIKPAKVDEKGDILTCPFGEIAVTKMFEFFQSTIQEIVDFYGPKTIFVDATMKSSEVRSFVETSVMRPPIPQSVFKR